MYKSLWHAVPFAVVVVAVVLVYSERVQSRKEYFILPETCTLNTTFVYDDPNLYPNSTTIRRDIFLPVDTEIFGMGTAGCGGNGNSGTYVVAVVPTTLPWDFTEVAFEIKYSDNKTINYTVVLFETCPKNATVTEAQGMPCTNPIAETAIETVYLSHNATGLFNYRDFFVNLTGLEFRSTIGDLYATERIDNPNITWWIGVRIDACGPGSDIYISVWVNISRPITGRGNDHPLDDTWGSDFTNRNIIAQGFNSSMAIYSSGKPGCLYNMTEVSSSLSSSSSSLPSSIVASTHSSSTVSSSVQPSSSFISSVPTSSSHTQSSSASSVYSSSHSDPKSSSSSSSSDIIEIVPQRRGLGLGAVIGIAVGGGLGLLFLLLLLVAVLVFALRIRRKKVREYRNRTGKSYGSSDFDASLDVIITGNLDSMKPDGYFGASGTPSEGEVITGTDIGEQTVNPETRLLGATTEKDAALSIVGMLPGVIKHGTGTGPCDIKRILKIEPEEPMMGEFTVDSPPNNHCDLILCNTSSRTFIDIAAIALGHSVYNIGVEAIEEISQKDSQQQQQHTVYPASPEDGKECMDTRFVKYELHPRSTVIIRLYAVALCTTSTKPTIVIAASTSITKKRLRKDSRRFSRRSKSFTGRTDEEQPKDIVDVGTSTTVEEDLADSDDGSFKFAVKAIYPSTRVRPSIKIDPADIERKEKIGEGAFSNVYKGKFRKHTDVAVKVYKQEACNVDTVKDLISEASIHTSLRSQYILQVYGIVAYGQLMMVTMYAHLGSLGGYIRKTSRTASGFTADSYRYTYGVSEALKSGCTYAQKYMEVFPVRLRLRYARDIAAGMAFLMESGIVHRDLKPDNVLIMSVNPDDTNTCCVISDFGTARMITERSNLTMTKGIGTPVYMAPEVLGVMGEKKIEYNESTDVYSYAVLLYMLFTGLEPYNSNEFKSSWEIMQFLGAKKRLDISVIIEETVGKIFGVEARNLIASCWNVNSEDRIKFSEAVDYVDDMLKRSISATTKQ